MDVTLYKGEREFTASLAVDEETGEIGTGVDLEVLVKQNPVGTIAHIKTYRANAKMVKEAGDALLKRAKAMEAHAEHVLASLKAVMQATGTTKVTSDDKVLSASLSVGADCSVDVYDESLLPSDYLRVVPATTAPDKAAIKEAIKAGSQVEGARLVYKDRLVIK